MQAWRVLYIILEATSQANKNLITLRLPGRAKLHILYSISMSLVDSSWSNSRTFRRTFITSYRRLLPT